MRVEQVTDPVAYHGEGPVWSERWGGLRWVDMLEGDVLSLANDGRIGRRHGGRVRALSPTEGPRLMDPGASLLPYSPECVEGKFFEVQLPLYEVLGS